MVAIVTTAIMTATATTDSCNCNYVPRETQQGQAGAGDYGTAGGRAGAGGESERCAMRD